MARSYTRRRLLQVTSAGAIGCLAGCNGLIGDNDNNEATPTTGDEESGQRPSELDVVPEGATAVAHIDTATLLDDEMVRQGFSRVIELFQRQRSASLPIENYEQALSLAESELGLDPEGLQSVTLFTSQMGTATGLLFEADWSEDEIVSTIESWEPALTSRSEDGHAIYSSENGDDGLVALADGRYLLAGSATIDSVLSVLAGEAESVGGELADAYADTSGIAGFVADMSGVDLGESEQLSAVEDATMVSGSLTASGDTRTFRMDVSMTDSNSASRLVEQANAALTGAEGQIDQYPEVQEVIENPGTQLDAIEVSQSGSTVRVTYAGSPELVGEGGMLILAAVVGSFVLGLGESTAVYPQASFNWDYDGESVTITHQSGDTIDGSNLYVRGTTGTGSIDKTWAEYGVDEVIAGTSVTVQNVTDSFDLDLVWVSDDGDASATLSVFVGPDA